MDYGGAVKLIEAAKQAGVSRYVIVSSMGANPKETRRRHLQRVPAREGPGGRRGTRERLLDATVVRPGGLTNDPGTGRVNLGEKLPRGQVTRDDVARSSSRCSTRQTRSARPWT